MDKANETRRRNQERQAEARTKSEESRAAIMKMLEAVATAEDATTEQKLEAARLAVQLRGQY